MTDLEPTVAQDSDDAEEDHCSQDSASDHNRSRCHPPDAPSNSAKTCVQGLGAVVWNSLHNWWPGASEQQELGESLPPGAS
jgi:hypothetical protein